MTDKPNGNGSTLWGTNGAHPDHGPSGDGGPDPMDDALAGVEAARATMEDFLAHADATSAWGEPVKNGSTLLIPASEVVAVAGFGVGGGLGNQGAGKKGGGGGGGGGGKVLVRSVAVVEVSDRGVRVRPVVDVTKIALAALTAFGFVAAGWLGLTRPTKTLRRLRDG